MCILKSIVLFLALFSFGSLANQQLLVIDNDKIQLADGKIVNFTVKYETKPKRLKVKGLQFKVFFDSSQINLGLATDTVYKKGLIGFTKNPIEDINDDDDNGSTTHYLMFAWLDMFGRWPSGNDDILLSSFDVSLVEKRINMTPIYFVVEDSQRFQNHDLSIEIIAL